MNIRTFLLIFPLLALLPASLRAQSRPAATVGTRWTPDSLRLLLTLSEPKAMGSRYAVWTTPRLTTAEGDTLLLQPAVFRGRSNLRYLNRQRRFAHTAPLAPGECLLGDTLRYVATVTRSAAPWLWQRTATLSLGREKDGCCATLPLQPAELGRLRFVPPFRPQLAVVPDNKGRAGELEKTDPVLVPMSQYRPYTRDRILSREQGALYVHFALDRTELLHDFRQNGPTLDRIVSITRQVMADSTSAVRRIQIVGLASVEGSLRHNEWLAGSRAEALKRYIQQRVPSADSLYEVVNGGEAWAELRAQVADLQFEGRDEMLRIIDSEPDDARREQRIKQLQGGRPYQYLRTHVLADQRNSGYLRIYYDYVPDTAAAVINRASELINQGRPSEALQQLRTVSHDRRAQNALGVALYLTGHTAEALECIRRAAADGNPQAADNLRQWQAIEQDKAEADN